MWTDQLEWSGQSEFQNLNYTILGNNGEYKTYQNFTFYKVFNAGHMVPMDQPATALDMLYRFINTGNLSDVEDRFKPFRLNNYLHK